MKSIFNTAVLIAVIFSSGSSVPSLANAQAQLQYDPNSCVRVLGFNGRSPSKGYENYAYENRCGARIHVYFMNRGGMKLFSQACNASSACEITVKRNFGEAVSQYCASYTGSHSNVNNRYC